MVSKSVDVKGIMNLLVKEMGHRIVRFEESEGYYSFYISHEFTPASKDVAEFHSLRGVDISSWVASRANHQSVPENEKVQFSQSLDNDLPIGMQFHKDVLWKQYLTY